MVFAMRIKVLVVIASLLLSSCVVLAQAPSGAASDQKPSDQKSTEQKPADLSQQVPSISADRGECSALFTVVDANGKPVYQASIHALVRWGLAHKTDLTVSTNYYGKAQFTRLPNYSKKPIAFEVSSGDKKRTVYFDPGNRCKDDFTVELK